MGSTTSRRSLSPTTINLSEKLAQFNEQWSPKIVAEMDGFHFKLAKLEGPFVWHHHEHEDELFLIVKGRLKMELRDGDVELEEGDVELEEGEMLVVPRGVEHRPVADKEVWLLMFEPASTVNTGSAGGERTVADPEWI